jgi:hypothetical protein
MSDNLTLGVQFGMSNIIIPKSGPKCVPASCDFSADPEILIDGELIVSQRHIEYLQGVFIDNADNPTPLTIVLAMTGQRIVARPHSQGYYAILMPNPPRMTVSTTAAPGRIVPLFFYNVPIQSGSWDCT